jgi:hypothetical protein
MLGGLKYKVLFHGIYKYAENKYVKLLMGPVAPNSKLKKCILDDEC